MRSGHLLATGTPRGAQSPATAASSRRAAREQRELDDNKSENEFEAPQPVAVPSSPPGESESAPGETPIVAPEAPPEIAPTTTELRALLNHQATLLAGIQAAQAAMTPQPARPQPQPPRAEVSDHRALENDGFPEYDERNYANDPPPPATPGSARAERLRLSDLQFPGRVPPTPPIPATPQNAGHAPPREGHLRPVALASRYQDPPGPTPSPYPRPAPNEPCHHSEPVTNWGDYEDDAGYPEARRDTPAQGAVMREPRSAPPRSHPRPDSPDISRIIEEKHNEEDRHIAREDQLALLYEQTPQSLRSGQPSTERPNLFSRRSPSVIPPGASPPAPMAPPSSRPHAPPQPPTPWPGRNGIDIAPMTPPPRAWTGRQSPRPNRSAGPRASPPTDPYSAENDTDGLDKTERMINPTAMNETAGDEWDDPMQEASVDDGANCRTTPRPITADVTPARPRASDDKHVRKARTQQKLNRQDSENIKNTHQLKRGGSLVSQVICFWLLRKVNKSDTDEMFRQAALRSDDADCEKLEAMIDDGETTGADWSRYKDELLKKLHTNHYKNALTSKIKESFKGQGKTTFDEYWKKGDDTRSAVMDALSNGQDAAAEVKAHWQSEFQTLWIRGLAADNAKRDLLVAHLTAEKSGKHLTWDTLQEMARYRAEVDELYPMTGSPGKTGDAGLKKDVDSLKRQMEDALEDAHSSKKSRKSDKDDLYSELSKQLRERGKRNERDFDTMKTAVAAAMKDHSRSAEDSRNAAKSAELMRDQAMASMASVTQHRVPVAPYTPSAAPALPVGPPPLPPPVFPAMSAVHLSAAAMALGGFAMTPEQKENLRQRARCGVCFGCGEHGHDARQCPLDACPFCQFSKTTKRHDRTCKLHRDNWLRTFTPPPEIRPESGNAPARR